MKNKIGFLFGCCIFLFSIQNSWGQKETILTRDGMSLKGKVKSIKYSAYTGNFENDIFIKGRKSAPNYESRPCIHTFFDEDGRIVKEVDYNADDECIKRVNYRYNKRGLLLYKQQRVHNRGVMELWRFAYDRENRLSEYRMYTKYVDRLDSDNPEKIFFDLGEIYSGASCVYDEENKLIKTKHIEDRWGKEVFYYDKTGNFIEMELPKSNWLNVEYEYDSDSRLVEVIYSGYSISQRTEYVYAKEGYLSHISIYEGNRNNKDSLRLTKSYEYDLEGHIIQEYISDYNLYAYEYEKNEQGDIVLKTTYSKDKLYEQNLYEYEYDSFGNWIARYEFEMINGKKGRVKEMEERILEYY